MFMVGPVGFVTPVLLWALVALPLLWLVLRAVPPAPPAVLPATAVVGLQARDRIERSRLSLDHLFDNPNGQYVQQAQTKLYVQQGRTRQFSAEDRFTAADRTRDNRYGERVIGMNLQADREFATGPLRHRLVYGADAARALVSNLRDGTVPPPGERFPNKAFADTDYDLVGAFAQNEIAFGESGVYATPGVRWDRFELDPRTDARFPGTPVALSGSRASPKFALRWRATERLSAYANWAQGYRAPTPGQVNNGFTNLFSPGFAYVSVSNPELRPERSATLELGLRGAHHPVDVRSALHLPAPGGRPGGPVGVNVGDLQHAATFEQVLYGVEAVPGHGQLFHQGEGHPQQLVDRRIAEVLGLLALGDAGDAAVFPALFRKERNVVLAGADIEHVFVAAEIEDHVETRGFFDARDRAQKRIDAHGRFAVGGIGGDFAPVKHAKAHSPAAILQIARARKRPHRSGP